MAGRYLRRYLIFDLFAAMPFLTLINIPGREWGLQLRMQLSRLRHTSAPLTHAWQRA
jgi:hypothetical protein